MDNYQSIDNVLEDGMVIHYNQNEHAVLKFQDFDTFIQRHPNITFLMKEKLVGKYTVDRFEQEGEEDKLLKKYREIKVLDSIIDKISISKKTSSNRCYEYELFNTKKISIKSFIDKRLLEKMDENFSQKLEFISSKLNSLSTSQLGLERSFLSKAIEDILKHNQVKGIEVTYIDIIEYIDEICEEYELLQKSYIDSLDSNSIRYDYQKKTQEINDKLQSISSDIQNKSILPPIALLIVLANIYNKPLMIQIITMMILFFFFALTSVYGYSQIKILNSHIRSIKEWKNFYRKFLSKNYIKLENRFKDSHDTAKRIRMIIKVTLFIHWIMYLGVIAFFFVKKF